MQNLVRHRNAGAYDTNSQPSNTMPIEIQETYANQDKDCIFGESGWYEPFTDSPGELFFSLRSEYGRCTGRVYRDLPDGGAKAVGWVFLKRMEYEDSHHIRSGSKTYLREVWVTVREKKD